MLTEFSLNNNNEMRIWDDFVKSHPLGTPFHLSSWIRIIQDTYSFKPALYVYLDDLGSITGLCPFFFVRTIFSGSRIVSIPFSDYCAPLTNDSSVEEEILKNVIDKNRNKFKYIEIRGPLSKDHNFVYHNYYHRYILELDPDPSKIYREFNKRTIQRSIKKAEKAGIQIKEDSSSYGLENFFRLNKLTRKKHGVPYQPKIFFENINKQMVSQGLAFILLATYSSNVIAASLFFKFNKVIYYKYNASDPVFLSSKNPNHLLIWHMVKKACLENYHTVDFGRASKDNIGLVRFKKMWGARCFDLPYYYYPALKGGAASSRESSFKYKMVTGIWKHLPDMVLDRISPVIMKQLA